TALCRSCRSRGFAVPDPLPFLLLPPQIALHYFAPMRLLLLSDLPVPPLHFHRGCLLVRHLRRHPAQTHVYLTCFIPHFGLLKRDHSSSSVMLRCAAIRNHTSRRPCMIPSSRGSTWNVLSFARQKLARSFRTRSAGIPLKVSR